jgi:hypothetical protein
MAIGTIEIHDTNDQHRKIYRASAVLYRNRTTRFTIEINNPRVVRKLVRKNYDDPKSQKL